MSATMPERLDRFDKATPWHLRDNNAPIDQEVTVDRLEVTGAIPTDLNGRFFRNGANPVSGWSLHWFIGDGMIHGIELAGGQANWYRNRWVRTPMFDNPGADRTELALDPETFTFDLAVSAANTHIISHGGRILALEEGAFPYEVTPELDTVGPYTFDGALTTAMTAHPKVCPETGELLFFGMTYGIEPPYFTYYRATADGVLAQATPISVKGPSMSHDFAVSRNHTVVLDMPAVFNLELAMQGGMPFRWDPDYGARIGVLPREGDDDDVKWFEVEDGYVFHTLNAHDDGDEVVVRGCRVPEIWVDDSAMAMDDTDPDDAPKLYEWRLNMASGAVSERLLDDRSSEFPRVADAEAGLDARYGYTMSVLPDGAAGELIKYDLADGASRTSHIFPNGHTPGEPVFVEAEGATNADDGYLMTFVYAADTDSSYLAILDASNMSAEPLATIATPHRVPTGFHGSWIPDA